MKKHLIALDLDGTLMSDYAEYDTSTIKYLSALEKAGHIIMIATGRPLRSSYFVYQAIGLKTPIINYNGALVTHPQDPKYPITDYRVDARAICEIIDFVGKDLINAFSEIHDDIFVQKYNNEIHSFLHVEGGHLHVGPLNKILPDNPNGALLFIKPHVTETLQSYIEENYSDSLRSRHWKIKRPEGEIQIMEIYNKMVNKGNGVKEAIKYFEIDPTCVIAIGDAHNDIEMLQAAHYKIAMGNASAQLLPHANQVTASISEQGVLKYLQCFFGTTPEKVNQ